MTVENPGAFPIADLRDADGCGLREGQPGMTLRDYFATPIMAKIFEGMAPLGNFSRQERDEAYAEAAVEAYAAADAMLSARQETRHGE